MLVIDSGSNNDDIDSEKGGHGRVGAWRGWGEAKTVRQRRRAADEATEMAEEIDNGLKLWFQAA